MLKKKNDSILVFVFFLIHPRTHPDAYHAEQIYAATTARTQVCV